MINCNFAYPQFLPGETAMSIVEHPPEINPGTVVKIVKPWFGSLCAVKLPDGRIHRWFAWFELKPTAANLNELFMPGNSAVVINSIGHGNPPHVQAGTIVQIVKCNPNTIFYDTILNNGEYHRWLAEFELAKPV